MGKILVTYFSKTGNTKKIAEAVFDVLGGHKTILPINEVTEVDRFNLIFIGFPVYSHSVPLPLEDFLKKIPEGKKIALFCTHGALPGSRLSREAIEHAVILASRARVLGTFSSRGKVSLEAMEILSKSPEHTAWTEMAPSAASHPDESDLEEARAFARMVTARETDQGF